MAHVPFAEGVDGEAEQALIGLVQMVDPDTKSAFPRH
jgi:hypothetical protein